MSEWADSLRERAREALPQLDGELSLAGLREPVEVLRDRWGVPHIYARNLHDLWFTQGYVATSERLFQIDFTFRLVTGRLAEIVSEMALPLDRFWRTVGLHRAGRAILGTYDEQDLEMVRPFSAGARAWLDTMPAKPVEYQVLEL